jgi:hypothetical protein
MHILISNVLTLKFGATEVSQDLLPVRRVLEATKVGLQLASQNLQCGTLSDTVGTDQTQDLTGSGHGQTVQLEAVGGVAVGDLALEVCGQVDDLDCVEGALLGADTASDTQTLTDEGNLAGGVDLDTQLSGLDDGTRLLALLATFLRLALVRVDDGDTVRGEYELGCPFFQSSNLPICDGAVDESDHRRGAGLGTHRVSLSLMFAVDAQAGDREWSESRCGWAVSLAFGGGGEVVDRGLGGGIGTVT